MEFDIILTNAADIPGAFEAGNDFIRLDNISESELKIINSIASRNDGITLIALPHPPRSETEVS